MAKERLTIGTRGSPLALRQTDIVAKALTARYPSLVVDVHIIQTHGDTNHNPIPLDTIGKGWFTKEIEQALEEKRIDLAEHSLKDMAEEMPSGLQIGAYLPREDARDVLITKNGEPLEALPTGAIIGTDSIRRQIQMRALRPNVIMRSLRGNVVTRLEKLSSEPYDAIILAVAGLKRLGLEDKITRYFTVDEITPAPGQGILVVQSRNNDPELQEMLAAINDLGAAHAASLERSFSRAMGGGCKSPVGAFAWRKLDECRLIGFVADEDGSAIYREELRAPWASSDHLGEELARTLLKKLHKYA